MPWYSAYLAALILLRLVASPRDKNALSIVLVAGAGSTLLEHFVTHNINEAWKLVIPASVETLTILALVSLGRDRSSLKQAVLLLIAWWAHLQCYVDIKTNGNVIYDNYEIVLGAVAVAQILAFYETFLSIPHTVQKRFELWTTGGARVSPSSSGTAVVHHPHKSGKPERR